MAINNVALMGRLVRDPEVRFGQKGSVCTFTLAIDKPKMPNQEKAETNYINCKAFNKQGETIGNYVNKGNRLFVEGSIETGSYVNKQGQKINTFDVVVGKFEFIDRQNGQKAQNNQSSFSSMGEDVDISF